MASGKDLTTKSGQNVAVGQQAIADAIRLSKRLKIQRCTQSLLHSCQCTDTGCLLSSCGKMKKLYQHMKTCKRRPNPTDPKGCPICRHMMALICYHAKHCQQMHCPFPGCKSVKQRIQQLNQGIQQQVQQRIQQLPQLFQQRLRQPQELRRYITRNSATITAPSVVGQLSTSSRIQLRIYGAKQRLQSTTGQVNVGAAQWPPNIVEIRDFMRQYVLRRQLERQMQNLRIASKDKDIKKK